MSQTHKFVVTCLVWTDRNLEDLKREIETRMGPMLYNNGIGELTSVKVKAAITPNQKEEKWVSTNN